MLLMRTVLDSSAFFSAAAFEGALYTTSSVISELRDLPSKARFDLLCEAGLQVMDPDRDFVDRVRSNAVKRGEAEVLSTTDIEVLALAVQLQAAIMSDDYALQNVARSLRITVIPLQQKGARNIRWKFRCSGCGRYYREPGVCQVCGALIQRKLK
jgi:endoribonuclease Nob1